MIWNAKGFGNQRKRKGIHATSTSAVFSYHRWLIIQINLGKKEHFECIYSNNREFDLIYEFVTVSMSISWVAEYVLRQSRRSQSESLSWICVYFKSYSLLLLTFLFIVNEPMYAKKGIPIHMIMQNWQKKSLLDSAANKGLLWAPLVTVLPVAFSAVSHPSSQNVKSWWPA